MSSKTKSPPKAKTSPKTPRPARPRRARTPRAGAAPVGEAVEADNALAAPRQPRGKLGVLVSLLRRPQGATIQDLAEATGWQVHSVRGAIAGALKKDRGLNVVSAKVEDGRVYRIEEATA